MATRSKLWSAGVVACMAALVLAALLLPQSFRLTAISDVIQCVLLTAGVIAFLSRAVKSQGRMRFFWGLLGLGDALWMVYQFCWTYFEVILHQDVPDLFSGDLVLFLHIVPFMAALALRPHIPRDEHAARMRRLDFAVLILWWVYLYVLIVMAWQYAVPDANAYSHNLNAVYLIEKIVFLGALAICWLRSRNGWKIFYANLFGASLLYAASSHVANWALWRHLYYSGSLYDIPLVAAMAWVALIGFWIEVREAEKSTHKVSTFYGVWVARFGMIAAFSLPLFAAWALIDTAVPTRIRSFRLLLTFITALGMGIMVFVRQRLLDRELVQLLNQSRNSVDNLRHLQTQIIQSEKLASVGQLVGGAAHELNNPITAMLGYSDLLLSTKLSTDQRNLAAKIGQQVRRTKSLVSSLLSFAHQGPATKAPIDLNILTRTAVKLAQPQWQALKIEVRMDLCTDLPKILGDSNQLLQVCLQIVSNSLHSMDERGGRVLAIRTQHLASTMLLEISEDAPDPSLLAAAEDPSPQTGEGLGLGACRGIVQEHHGRISGLSRADGGHTVRVELPAYLPSAQTVMAPAPVLLAQSRPSA